LSLHEIIATLLSMGRRMAPALATGIAAQIASGLSVAHDLTSESGKSLGLVHRDISPKNIIISRTGSAKLCDFGIAISSERRARRTGTGYIKGKFRYMSPEQAYGAHLDRRSDIYSLGIVLWECLTGHSFFQADDNVKLIHRVREPGPPLSPALFNPRVSPLLEETVKRALARNPEERFPSAGSFRESLLQAEPNAEALSSRHLSWLIAKVTPRGSASVPPPVPDDAVRRAPTVDGDRLDEVTARVQTDEAVLQPAGGSYPEIVLVDESESQPIPIRFEEPEP
jgi:serine/threonine-protein kinase